jgi:hypothetical protein
MSEYLLPFAALFSAMAIENLNIRANYRGIRTLACLSTSGP